MSIDLPFKASFLFPKLGGAVGVSSFLGPAYRCSPPVLWSAGTRFGCPCNEGGKVLPRLHDSNCSELLYRSFGSASGSRHRLVFYLSYQWSYGNAEVLIEGAYLINCRLSLTAKNFGNSRLGTKVWPQVTRLHSCLRHAELNRLGSGRNFNGIVRALPTLNQRLKDLKVIK
jgi:hypothetical protein